MTHTVAGSDSRIAHVGLRDKIMSAAQAATFVRSGDAVGMSGFVGAGCPKVLPGAIAEEVVASRERGEDFRIDVLTGASTSSDLDGVLAEVDGIRLRMPYQSDATAQHKINSAQMDYVDVHLSHVAQQVWMGFYPRVDVAVIEVAGITEDGKLIPSSSVGNNKTWLDLADRVILEVNAWQPLGAAGLHDIYYGTALPPNRAPIPLVGVNDRIGQPFFDVDPSKVVAIVETNLPDRETSFTPQDAVSTAIADHVLDFFEHEVKVGRMPKGLAPLQSGVGNVPNAVLSGLAKGGYRGLSCYSEVIQDGMLDLIKDGTIDVASATGLAFSREGMEEFRSRIDFYREHIVLRPQEISNHPELIRRLGVISMNGMLEADIYGNVNSTHVLGTRMKNGIGGSGDFTRNAFVSMFVSPSIAKRGAISAIVPFASHIDHTEHDVHVIVTEQGLADLRALPPRKRADAIIRHCAHPDYRPLLEDYVERAQAHPRGGHTPHLLSEALSWHERCDRTGTMLPGGHPSADLPTETIRTPLP